MTERKRSEMALATLIQEAIEALSDLPDGTGCQQKRVRDELFFVGQEDHTVVRDPKIVGILEIELAALVRDPPDLGEGRDASGVLGQRLGHVLDCRLGRG